MTKKQEDIYQELKLIAEQLGFKIRLEIGDFDGGICVVKEKEVLVLNKRHMLTKRISVLVNSLVDMNLDSIFVKPAIRDYIEKESSKKIAVIS
ncbi:MAG: hypothetical protein IPP65_07050 [Chlorobi bacterium]|jgi:hypothetical protein|nr:hypothetical protein [Chlorobiota bacterium]